MSNVRTIDAVAQVFTNARAEMRQHAVLSPGQLRELARGECGQIQALQVAGDFKTVFFACDNGLFAIRLADDLAVAALRALMHTTIRMEDGNVRELERSRFRLDPNTGTPIKITTEPR